MMVSLLTDLHTHGPAGVHGTLVLITGLPRTPIRVRFPHTDHRPQYSAAERRRSPGWMQPPAIHATRLRAPSAGTFGRAQMATVPTRQVGEPAQILQSLTCPPCQATSALRSVIGGCLSRLRGVEDIVLPAVVPDLDALGTSHIDRVFPGPYTDRVDKLHQRLRGRHQIRVSVRPGLGQFRPEWSLPYIGSLLMLGEHKLGIWPTAEPALHQSLQRRVRIFDRSRCGILQAQRSACRQSGQD
jgi:hypothetical protein